MQRAGLVRVSSMTAVCEAPRADRESVHLSLGEPPWKTHLLYTCEHLATKPRLKVYERGGTRAMRQCLECGRKVGNFIAVAGVSEPWDDELEQAVLQEYERAKEGWENNRKSAWESATDDVNSRWWQEYERYLRTSVWAVKRELVMKRCQGVCEACGQRRAEHVHHLKYPEVFGLEPLWDLRAVCVPCHKLIHPHME
jgi:hypothetical protein